MREEPGEGTNALGRLKQTLSRLKLFCLIDEKEEDEEEEKKKKEMEEEEEKLQRCQ